MRGNSPKPGRRKGGNGSAYSTWTTWVPSNILKSLQSSKWQDVSDGIDSLHKQFVEQPTTPSVPAYGLMTVFHGRTFAPKVMKQLINEILFYLKEDPATITEDTIQAGINFLINKIIDKKLEQEYNELGDILCAHDTTPVIFQALYPSLSEKSPQLLARILNYFAHAIRTYGIETKLDSNEVANSIHPLCTHADLSVRKECINCVSALVGCFGEEILEHFKELKKSQIDEVKKFVITKPCENLQYPDFKNGNGKTEVTKPKQKTELPKREHKPEPQPEETVEKEKEKEPKKSQIPKPEKPKRNVSANPEKKKTVRTSRNIPTRSSSRPVDNFMMDDDLAMLEMMSRPSRKVERSPVNSRQPEPFYPPQSDNLELFDPSLLKMLDRQTPVLDARRAVDDLEKTASSLLAEGKTIKMSDAKPLIDGIAPWLGNQSIPLLTSCCHLLNTLFKLLQGAVLEIDPAFIELLISVLNMPQMLNPVIEVIGTLYNLNDAILPSVALDIYNDLTKDGKSGVLTLLSKLHIQITVQKFVSIVCNVIMENIQDDVSFVNNFLKLNGAEAALRENANQFTEENRALIISKIPIASAFQIKPIKAMQEKRSKLFDKAMPSKAIDSNDSELIINYLDAFWNMFAIPLQPNSMELTESLTKLYNDLEHDFESFSLAFDLVCLWLANVVINDPSSGTVSKVSELLSSFLNALNRQRQKLTETDSYIIIPLAVFLNENGNKKPRLGQLAIELTPSKTPPLSIALENMKNSEAILSLTENVEFDEDDKLALVEFVQSLVRDGKAKADEWLAQCGVSLSSVRCEMSPALAEVMRSNTFLVYQWIAELQSSDIPTAIEAIKSITRQVDIDPGIFKPHLEALVLSIISKIHVFFSTDPPPSRLFKYIAFLVFTLLDKTELPSVISYECVRQIVYEVITRLTNGLPDAIAAQSLNFLLVKLMECCTVLTFRALICAIGEFDGEVYTERWVRLAQKCFDPCRDQVLTLCSNDDIEACLLDVEGFLQAHDITAMKDTSFGSKVIFSIRVFVSTIGKTFPAVLESNRFKAKIGPNPRIFSV